MTFITHKNFLKLCQANSNNLTLMHQQYKNRNGRIWKGWSLKPAFWRIWNLKLKLKFYVNFINEHWLQMKTWIGVPNPIVKHLIKLSIWPICFIWRCVPPIILDSHKSNCLDTSLAMTSFEEALSTVTVNILSKFQSSKHLTIASAISLHLWLEMGPKLGKLFLSMLHPCRILQKFTTFGESNTHMLTFSKSPSNIAWGKNLVFFYATTNL